MPAEHLNKDGKLTQGYFCMTCGMSTGMCGHSVNKDDILCASNPELVQRLIEINTKKEKGERQMLNVSEKEQMFFTYDIKLPTYNETVVRGLFEVRKVKGVIDAYSINRRNDDTIVHLIRVEIDPAVDYHYTWVNIENSFNCKYKKEY